MSDATIRFGKTPLFTQSLTDNSNSTTRTIFREPELPQTYIENFVSLYNSGLFDEVQFASNHSTNQIGITNAFNKRIFNIIPKFKLEKKQQQNALAKLVHLVPHKYSNILHHIHCQKQLPHFPLQYFVARYHSGFSVSPYKDIWAKHENETSISRVTTINDNMITIKPSNSSLSFEPSRIELTEELQIHPLKTCCETTKTKSCKKHNLRQTVYSIRRIYLIRTPTIQKCCVQTKQGNVEEVYQILCRANDIEHVPIEQFISNNLQKRAHKRQLSESRILPKVKNELQIETSSSSQLHNDVTIYDLHLMKDPEYIPIENSVQFLPKNGNNSQKSKFFNGSFLEGLSNFTPSIDLKQKDGKKETKKKKKADKGGAKEKKNVTTGTEVVSTSTSSSSSSSSNSENEAEKVHVLVQQQTQKSEAPLKHIVEESPVGNTTVETWHEETIGPEHVTTEVDEQGNIRKTITRTEQIKHTVQTQSYQTVVVPDNEERFDQKTDTSPPVLNSELLNDERNENNLQTQSELVSSKVITTGNRTVETLTYKTEKDGIVETKVEHRITIYGNEGEFDHDAELGEAIMEVTNMNPELKVEKVEVERDGNGTA